MENTYVTNINVSKLRKEVIAREDKKFKTFEKILDMCYQKILNSNKTSSECCCTFICPNMIFGLPLFNIYDCIKYLMEKLFEKGFEVHLALPNKLFISWKPESEHNIEYCKTLYLTNIPANTNSHILQNSANNSSGNDNDIGILQKSKQQKQKSQQNKNNYRSINDYKETVSNIYDTDDLSLFSDKIDNLFS